MAASGTHRRSNNTASTGSIDLANHPDIEFLAEATLVVDSVENDDDEDMDTKNGQELGGRGEDGHDDTCNGDDPPPDYDKVVGDSDVSTIGAPPELALPSQLRSRSTSHGSANTGRSSRHRRSVRPADSIGDVSSLPMATCTSIDEANNGPETRRSRHSAIEVPDGAAGAGPSATNDSPDGEILVAEPLKDKCLLPRRAVMMGLVIGLALLLALGLGVAIPLSKRDNGPFPPDGGNETYPASKFNPPDNEVLTFVPEPICYSLLPIMTNVSKACTDPTGDFPKGSPLVQLIADGLLSASDPDAGIDVVLTNAGGYRSDIFAGDLTAGHIRKKVAPFTNNRVAYLSVTPAELYDTLNGALFDTGFVITEEQQRQFFPESPTVKLTWPVESHYPYAAGLRYDVDLNAPEGQKATNIRLRTKALGSGQVKGTLEEDGSGADVWVFLDPTDTTTLIRVLTSDFLAGGGDGFFQTVPEERIEIADELGLTQLFMYYCSLQEELFGPHKVDDMSTRNFVPLEGYENEQ